MKPKINQGIISLLFFFVLAMIPQSAAADGVVAKVLEVEGGVELDRGNLLSPVQTGLELEEGDLVTTDETGRVLIQWAGDESLIKMAVSSQLKIKSNEEEELRTSETRLFLARGVMWGKKEKNDRTLKIETSLVTLGVRGTEYFVKAGSNFSELAVKEGRVRLEKEGVDAGNMTRVLVKAGETPVFFGLSGEELEAWTQPFV